MVQSERQALKQHVIGEKEIVDEAKSAIRLVVQHAAGSTRSDGQQSVGDAPERTGADAARGLRRRVSEMDRAAWPRCSPRSKSGWRAPCATNLPRFRSGSAVRSSRRSTKFGRRHSARCNNFGIACRIAPCGRSASVADDGNRNRCRGTQYTRYPSRTSVRQELGTAVAGVAGVDDQGRGSPPFCAHDLLPGCIRTSAGSARSGKRALIARCGASRRKPAGGWMS